MVATSSNLSPEQLAIRAQGITATDIAAIVGVHPYRSAIDVWSEKMGHTQAFEGNDRTRWGNLLEPVLRADYESTYGVRVEVHGTHTHEDWPWMTATPDGLVYEANDAEPARGLEIKCHTIHLAYLYGNPGTDEVPDYELCQVGWGMAVTELMRWDLRAFIDGQPRDYIIDRDQSLIDTLFERAQKFRTDYVLSGNPPPPDGSEAYSDWQAAKFKSDNALAHLITINPDEEPQTFHYITRLKELRDEIAALEEQEGLCVQHLKARIGDAAGIQWPNGKPAAKKGKYAGQVACDRITWKKNKDGERRDYATALEALRMRAQLVWSLRGDIERATTALDKLADEYFANSRAQITGAQVKELIVAMRDLTEMAANARPVVIPTVGPRQFRVPTSWKKRAGEE